MIVTKKISNYKYYVDKHENLENKDIENNISQNSKRKSQNNI